ncbi:MAG: hypothetical protein ACD_75C00142G0001, partial [uncultured bacterium]
MRITICSPMFQKNPYVLSSAILRQGKAS